MGGLAILTRMSAMLSYLAVLRLKTRPEPGGRNTPGGVRTQHAVHCISSVSVFMHLSYWSPLINPENTVHSTARRYINESECAE